MVKTLRDGTLSVTETVTVPIGQQLEGHVEKRVAAGDDQDRVYTIREAKVTGPGKVDSTGDELLLALNGGQSVVTYTVDGSVEDIVGGQQVRWQVTGSSLGEFERAVFAVLLPGDVESVRLTESRAAGVGIGAVRDEPHGDLVRRRWFSRRPDEPPASACGCASTACS